MSEIKYDQIYYTSYVFKINVRECWRGSQNGQSRKTGKI